MIKNNPILNIFFIKCFIKHYLTSTFIDVLHSPFVFNLYQTCIKKQNDKNEMNEIEFCRNELLLDNKVIKYIDLGAGSNLLNNKINKKVKEIAHSHLKPKRIAHIIYYIILNFKVKNVIELGTSLGITSSYIAQALKNNYKSNEVNFTTIEGIKEVKEIANIQFKKLHLNDYIHSMEGNFNTELHEVLKNYKSVDVFFVDGNHTYDATMNYFNLALPYSHNDSIFIFDDIYWSKGMTKAWEEIKNNSKVLQTVDLFFIGLVLFRSEQKSQHFKLRVI